MVNFLQQQTVPQRSQFLAKFLQNQQNQKAPETTMDGAVQGLQALAQAFALKKGFQAQDAKQEGINKTLAEALSDQVVPSDPNAMGPIQPRPSDSKDLARVLASNPDTAPMAFNMKIDQIGRAEDLKQTIAAEGRNMANAKELFGFKQANTPKKDPLAKMRALMAEPELAEFDRQQRKASAASTNVNIDNVGGEGAQSTQLLNKTIKAKIEPILEMDIGTQRLANDRVKSALEAGTDTGSLSGMKIFAGRMGFPVEDLEGLETIEEVSNALAVPMTKQLGVNPTDRDFSIILSTVANVGKSAEANKNFVFINEQLLDRNELIQNEIRAMSANGAKLMDIDNRIREIKATNPIALPEINDVLPPAGGVFDPSTASEEELDAFLKANGG